MRNKLKLYSPLLIVFGAVLLVAVILGLTCVGVATMDTSTKLAHADSWQPSNPANTRFFARSLNSIVNEDYVSGLWYNTSVGFRSNALLDRFLQYFTTPYEENVNYRFYFQPIGYLYGGYSTQDIAKNSSFSASNGVTSYVVPVGYYAVFRRNVSTNAWSAVQYSVGTLNASNEYGNMTFIAYTVLTSVGPTYDWRLSNNTYSLGKFVDGSFVDGTIPPYINYYHSSNGDTWTMFPVSWRNTSDPSGTPTDAYIQGWYPTYSDMPQEAKDIYGREPLNCMGDNGDTVSKDLRDFLSQYISFGVNRETLVTDSYEVGYANGNKVGYQVGYDNGFEEGETNGFANGVDYSKTVVYTDSASYSAGVDNANRTVTPSSASFSAGYNKGIDDAGNYTFSSLIGAVVDVPVKTLLSLLNFEILGVDMSAFFLSLFTFCLLLLILRLILGR